MANGVAKAPTSGVAKAGKRRAWFHADLHVWLAIEVDVSNERKERGHELGHELCSISGPSFAVRWALAVRFAPIP